MSESSPLAPGMLPDRNPFVFAYRTIGLGEDLIDLRRCRTRFVLLAPGDNPRGDSLLYYLMDDGRWVRHERPAWDDWRERTFEYFHVSSPEWAASEFWFRERSLPPELEHLSSRLKEMEQILHNLAEWDADRDPDPSVLLTDLLSDLPLEFRVDLDVNAR